MAKDFRTSRESLAKLGSYVLKHFPESDAELFLTALGGQVSSERGQTSRLLVRLQDYCAEFPRGLLRLRIDHPYGIVVTLWCHCTENTGCALKCACDAERPRAVLAISESVIGNTLSPPRQMDVSIRTYEESKLSLPAKASS